MNSDPIQVCQLNWIPLFAALIGGGLSIIGGFGATILKLRAEKKQEIEYIKIGLIDELEEIISVVEKMLETCRTSKTIPRVYFNNLIENTKAFEDHRPRLFLIGDKNIRRDINAFYKELVTEVEHAKVSVGSLKEGVQTDAATVTPKFEALKTRAGTLKFNLENYKYKILYFR